MYGLIGFCGLFAQSFLGLFADYFLTVLTITSMPKGCENDYQIIHL